MPSSTAHAHFSHVTQKQKGCFSSLDFGDNGLYGQIIRASSPGQLQAASHKNVAQLKLGIFFYRRVFCLPWA